MWHVHVHVLCDCLPPRNIDANALCACGQLLRYTVFCKLHASPLVSNRGLSMLATRGYPWTPWMHILGLPSSPLWVTKEDHRDPGCAWGPTGPLAGSPTSRAVAVHRCVHHVKMPPVLAQLAGPDLNSRPQHVLGPRMLFPLILLETQS